MSSVDSLSIYLKIIDRTIEKSRGLQTPEMLEQLKLRWISKLNDLCLGITKDEKSDRNQEWVPTEMEVIAPKLDGVFPVKIESVPKKSDIIEMSNNNINYGNMNNSNNISEFNSNEITVGDNRINNKRFIDGSIQKIPTPIISSKEMRNVNELNIEYDFCKMVSKKSKIDGSDSKYVGNEDEKEIEKEEGKEGSAFSGEKQNTTCEQFNTERCQNFNENESNNDFEDDEFGDASWDVVAPSESESTKDNLADNFQEQSKSKSNNQNGTTNAQISGNSDRFDEEIFSDPGSDLENVSDLDDEEPECNDVIIGHFEKVIRPYTRKKNQKGKWRVKLRNGIAQIANQEIPFDTLIGEFEF
ncbi:Transcription factor IIA alpha/beta subunit family protein [Cryptosporidium meleagridis]|uniref:Transcription factor IIA alpha/beta subunit family protein n=1 Tax=Cryptosporidium meleagridis TaxID=93969 RepID=A0A2P4Z619_9CRYT|nr:Transcription factor IIA alpha/beta subunit family protein [Cryptosporidium meleagridis]